MLMSSTAEQTQKSKSVFYGTNNTQHELFRNKSPKQHKCDQQICNTQSQVQHIHAYLRPANTDRSYNIEKEEK